MGGAPTLKTKSVKFNFMMNMILSEHILCGVED